MEEIIYKYLCSQFNNESSIALAEYCSIPAIFNTSVPDDKDENWGDEQYPRVVFELDMQSDPERKISGNLYIDIMCENETESVQPEDIESLLKGAVDGCFFSNPELTISAQWTSSNAFNDNKDTKVSGITLTFDIMAYPVQETQSPDPILAVNLWLKTLYQDAYVIGRDTLPETWKPTDNSPAIYCRLVNLGESSRMKSTAAVTWIGADMRINIMAPSEQNRSNIIKSCVQILINATRLILDDGSPMLIDNVSGSMGSNPLKEGQIQIKATYGVLNEYTGTPIKQAYVRGMQAEREVNDGN